MKRVHEILNLKNFNGIRNNPADFSIAILDSGTSRHPDVVQRIIAFKDMVQNRNIMYDDYGHGTHIAGILCGRENREMGFYGGIVPNGKLVVVKILNENGKGELANLLKALKWILDYHTIYKIRIVNISIGLDGKTADNEELFLLLKELYHHNIMVVAAAGNSGPSAMSISKIGISNHVLAVGCHDLGNNASVCEVHSARGPSGYGIIKPDIVAPGSDILSCDAKFNKGKRFSYTRKSGTSMSAAVASGCGALMLLANPKLQAEDLFSIFHNCAIDLKEPQNKQGWGFLNLQRMVDEAIRMR